MADTTIKLSGTYDSIEAYELLEEMRSVASDYLPLTGGEITGDLIVDGQLSGDLTGTASGNLPLTGGTLTGDVEGVTPASNDNSAKLTNTEWVVGFAKDNVFLLDDSHTPTIPSNSNLNNYATAGTYRSTSASTSGSLSNCPVTSYAFKLFVIEIGYGSNAYCMQIIMTAARHLRGQLGVSLLIQTHKGV